MFNKGGIAPNQVIARSEFEVHRQIVTSECKAVFGAYI